MAADQDEQRGYRYSIPVSSDWIKTIVAIIVQSIAVGFYLAAVKSDLVHLTGDFAEFKSKMNTDIAELNLSFSQLIQVKSKMEMMVDDIHRSFSRVDDLDKDVKDIKDKIQEFKFQVKDITRDVDLLKEGRPNEKRTQQ